MPMYKFLYGHVFISVDSVSGVAFRYFQRSGSAPLSPQMLYSSSFIPIVRAYLGEGGVPRLL